MCADIARSALEDRIFILTTLLANCPASKLTDSLEHTLTRQNLIWNDVSTLLTLGLPNTCLSSHEKSSIGPWRRRVSRINPSKKDTPSESEWSWPAVAVAGHLSHTHGPDCTVVVTRETCHDPPNAIPLSVKELRSSPRTWDLPMATEQVPAPWSSSVSL